MIITCAKIGDGTLENPFRPDTEVQHWNIYRSS